MTMRFRRPMLVLGTTILIMQAMFMPVGMVYAETTMDTEEQELVELPPMKDYLEEEQISDPRFFFTRPRMQGTAEEPLEVTFFSDQEVSEARILLPEEATLLKDQLPTGISVEEGVQPNEWIIQSERTQNTFVLPLVFEKAGNYELSVEETMAHLEISDPDNKIIDDYPLSEMEPSDDSPQNQENWTMKEENKIRSFSLDQIRMLFGTQGNLISGDSNFNYSDIARARISVDSTLVWENDTTARLTNAGYFSGEKFDVLISGIPRRRISLGRNEISVSPENNQRAYTDEYTITAVYAESNEVVNAKIMFSLINQHRRFTSHINVESVFRIAVIERRRNSVSLSNDQIVLQGSGNIESFGGDMIISNGALITTRAAALGVPVRNGYVLFGSGYAILPNQNFERKVQINHINIENSQILQTETISGEIGTRYVATPMDDENYDLISPSENLAGIFKEEDKIVNIYYQLIKLTPVDPLDPDSEVDPENTPKLPEDQGKLSIDFISSFNFGSQAISVHDQVYYAKPQRLLNEDGTVNETEERPNYVQISDRRPASERNGWQLSVTQNGQFRNKSGHELIGSEIQLFNQELVTAQDGTIPELQEEPVQQILPNTRKVLIQANGESGTGTWIYRFGDQQTADKSVGLYVPGGTNPEATSYSTKLTWELSSVPEN
ncbi:WxL domain-containing protein [Enterococcus mundtii]|uniref:WxL domain-containing protein n=1 Tax=Enterococcus mundtii TaxID=53346 RepID=UPI00032DEE56|nr:WxL domain-containing protein [Enterococcus mundtii]EOH60539.1 hypothetical protein UAC_02665 [Enterococcus mundtii ATCC 882]EOU11659.1 hypothetical protein I587_00174 [Enterococcus mundtii ATCC 882]